MWTTNEISLVEFYRRSFESALEGGYRVLLCLVARHADAPQLFSAVKRDWESFHDLTGPDVMFLFAGDQASEDVRSSGLLKAESDPALNRSATLLFSSSGAIAGRFRDFERVAAQGRPVPLRPRVEVTNGFGLEEFLGARENPDTPPSFRQHSLQISELRDLLRLKEQDLPCLHISFIDEREHYAIKVGNYFPLYDFIKAFRLILDDSPYYSPADGLLKSIRDFNRLRQAIITERSRLKRLKDDPSLRLRRFLEELEKRADDEAPYAGPARHMRQLILENSFCPIEDNWRDCYAALRVLDKALTSSGHSSIQSEGQRVIQDCKDRRFAGRRPHELEDITPKRNEILDRLGKAKRDYARAAETLDELRAALFGSVDNLIERFGAHDTLAPPAIDEAGNDVFISYSRLDQGIIEKLMASLKERAFKVWWDNDIPISVRFRHLIRRKIASSRAVLTVWSSHSVASDWVVAEASLANRLKKLVAVKTAELDSDAIPLPFGEILKIGDLNDIPSIEQAILDASGS